MRLGNRRVCVCGANTAVQATGGPTTSGIMCVSPHRCVLPASEHEWVTISWIKERSPPPTTTTPHSHTLYLFLLSWRLSATLYLHTSLTDQRTALFISFSLLILCWNESPEWLNCVCLHSSCLILPSALVKFVCLCRSKCWKCWTIDWRIKSWSCREIVFSSDQMFCMSHLNQQSSERGRMGGWKIHAPTNLPPY